MIQMGLRYPGKPTYQRQTGRLRGNSTIPGQMTSSVIGDLLWGHSAAVVVIIVCMVRWSIQNFTF